MNAAEVLETVLHSKLITRWPNMGTSASRSLSMSGLKVPAGFRRLLSQSDGLSAYGGFFRVFGMNPASGPTLLTWNLDSTWKFAWPNHARDYFCFGETGFGDQYAFRYDELGASSPPVYLLEALALKPEPLTESFENFLADEFLRNAAQPYDEMITAARAIIGDLARDEHVTFSPSPLLTGEESVEHIVKLPSIAAMVLNGDLATQLCDERRTGSVAGIEIFDDEQGRSRIRVNWIEAP